MMSQIGVDFPFHRKTTINTGKLASPRIMVGNSLYTFQIVEDNNNTIKVCRIDFNESSIIKRVYEFDHVKINNIDTEHDDNILALQFIGVGELNGDFYMFSESKGSIRNVEQVHRLQLGKENKFQVETIYKSFETSFVRFDSPLLADKQRNCFYWFGGIRYRKSTTLRDCIKFNVESCDFETYGDFPMGHVFHTHSSVFWKNRFVVTFGGWVSSCQVTANIFAFDVETRNWYSIYCIDDGDETVIPHVYPRFNSGMDLIPNWWASKFDSTIPSNNDMDTLFIYGGYIEYYGETDENCYEIAQETDEILLFHLDESLFEIGEVNIDTRIPFSLTNYCKEFRAKKQDNSLEDTFKILPITDISTVHYFKDGNNGREMLYIWNGYNPEHITKLDLCDIRSLFNEKSRNYWDIQFSFA